MNFARTFRLPRARLIIAAAVMAIAGLLVPASQAASARTGGGAKPTIVLEHGAWADSSGWNGVIRRLQHDGYSVLAPPNPLRGLSNDAATLADFLSTIAGPIVLVAHSYGGAVVTNAATGNPNVKALVYIDAFIPDQGENAFGLAGADSCLAGDPTKNFKFVPYPGAPAGDVDLYLNTPANPPYPGFAACFANGVPAPEVALLAVTQRPLTLSAGTAPSGSPAWKTIPSWALIGTADHVIPPTAQQFMAGRAHAHITKINAGHLSLISRPGAVTNVILNAIHATR
ncbi:MAG TPA: alpha/beta hydrolase [Streptosporangiaceae bacterium]|jgi:pimeloyl-ACP methyl ester carboxylesterase